MWNNKNNVVKFKGECWNKAKKKYCSFWKAQHASDITTMRGPVIKYVCTHFDKPKPGYNSLPECNKKYGLTYDGRQKL